ncbi:transcription factor IIIB 50 kDa subunit-like [Actinia tenebrosa]|uniref:Transcription factor IIIB 50 kDa subunit-like n=1 Tax=Actinia tenebrosa TaxID=6105 RepID=A0A6P8HLL8_ACTTE|nr:transcription factor IIIB 50 kDa subunit-like [Actinia tenebrosa]
MNKICTHCGASAIEVDDEGKLEVCSNCGVVCNEGSFHNDTRGAVRTFTSDHSSFSGGAGNWRKKEQHRVKNKHFVIAKRCLEGQAERLRLSKEYTTQIEEKLKTLYEEQLYKGLPRNRKAFVGACVYIVCRQNDMVVTLRNVAEAARCDVSILARCVRMLTDAMNVRIVAIEPDEVITNILSQFEIQDPSTKKLVHDLFQFCSKTMISLGKRITLTVMALVFMVIEGENKKALSRKKIAEVCRFNTVTHEYVQRFVRQYREELFKLAKKIPWMSSELTPKKVPKFLKEILEYYKDCEDFHNVDFKPQWLERKDLKEKEKMQKIEKAENRIAACQQRCGDLEIDDNISLHKFCKQICRSSTQTSNSEVSFLPSSASVLPTESELGSEDKQKHCKEVPSNSSENPASDVSSLPSDLSTATELVSEDDQMDIDHVCCPHCCVNKQDCPVYQRTGSSRFCKLDGCDMIIECLLRKGYSRQRLIESNPESLFYSENYNTDSEAEREELDDGDICDEDIHLYIKSDHEIAQTQMLKINVTS